MGCLQIIKAALSGHPTDQASYASSATAIDATALKADSIDEKAVVEHAVPSKAKANPTGDRLAALRELMAEQNLDLYVVTSEDAHGSEYTAARDQLRAFISGFTGSAGVAIIGRSDFAGLWADGRYWIQAGNQLDENWTLFKAGAEGVPSWSDWLRKGAFDQLKTSTLRVGLDSRLLPYRAAKDLFAPIDAEHELVPVFEEKSLVRDVWTTRFKDTYPPAPKVNVHEHPLKYTGQAATTKISNVVKWLDGAKAEDLLPGNNTDGLHNIQASKQPSHYVVNALDEIAWVLNVRAVPSAISFTPVFPGYLVISKNEGAIQSPKPYRGILFVDEALVKPNTDVYDYLTKELEITLAPYDAVWDHMRSLPSEATAVVSENASFALVSAVGDDRSRILKPGESPLALWKSTKNSTEVAGMRRGYATDGVAWAQWAAWLEEQITVKKRRDLREMEAAEKLVNYRKKMPEYVFEAYEPIASYGPNAALPHYDPATDPNGGAIIGREKPFLCDSGGQYKAATIDTTRTVHFGKPTAAHRRSYTRVLQGHIALSSAVFPFGTNGYILDCLARRPLWQDGKDFSHGTGHGLGCFLGVHELFVVWSASASSGGPPSSLPKLRPGMTLTVEPGYYVENDYGIRIESLYVVVPAEIPGSDGNKKWLRLERLTRVPIDTNLVEWKLLSADEKKWLKEHNEQCKTELRGRLKGDKRALKWLLKH